MKRLLCRLFGHRDFYVTPWNDGGIREACARCGSPTAQRRKGSFPRCLPR